MGADRETLYGFGVEAWPWLPELAERWLFELLNAGLHELVPLSGAPPKQAGGRRPAIEQVPTMPPVRVEGHRQAFWLDLNGPRTGGGYKSIVVLDKPLMTQTAIVAALTVLEGQHVDIKRLSAALAETGSPFEESLHKQHLTAWFSEEGENEGFLSNLQYSALHFVLALIRYSRPDFDDLSRDDQLHLVKGVCERVNALLVAADSLMAFLEYGAHGKNTTTIREDAERDVRAAVLKHVEHFGNVEIAERLGIKIKASHRRQNDHSTVREMVKRGIGLLKGALGEEGWQEKVKVMEEEATRWQGLTIEEQKTELYAEHHKVSVEKAREEIAQARRRGTPLFLGSVHTDREDPTDDRRS